MISVTRLNGSQLWLNPMLIETVEETPDSVVMLTNGHRYVVRETPGEIAERVRAFFVGPRNAAGTGQIFQRRASDA